MDAADALREFVRHRIGIVAVIARNNSEQFRKVPGCNRDRWDEILQRRNIGAAFCGTRRREFDGGRSTSDVEHGERYDHQPNNADDLDCDETGRCATGKSLQSAQYIDQRVEADAGTAKI